MVPAMGRAIRQGRQRLHLHLLQSILHPQLLQSSQLLHAVCMLTCFNGCLNPVHVAVAVPLRVRQHDPLKHARHAPLELLVVGQHVAALLLPTPVLRLQPQGGVGGTS
jgi:hypothetical protein